MEQCPARNAVRIRLAEDRRVLAPVARSIYGWQGYYDQRSAVDRVNARWAGGFEHPFIRRLAKMRLRVTMASTTMPAMASGRIKASQPEYLRSLVDSA